MSEGTNELSPADLAILEQDKAGAETAETPEAVAKETETQREEPKAEVVKEEPKQPTEIEVVSEEEADSVEPDARKYIKVGVLRKEREKARQFRQEAETLRQQIAALQKAQQEPPREITPEEAPHVALERVQNLERALQEQAAKQSFVTAYAQKAQEFAAEHDDFQAAYNHALSVRRGIYETAGYAPQQVAQLLESEEAAIAERAFMDGKNPAAVIYDIAKKLGYQAKAKEAPKEAEPDKSAVIQKQTADATLEAAKKLAQIQKGMDKNKSLSGAGGGNEAPSLEELVMMDDAAFEKHTSGAKFKELMGG